MIDRYVNCRIGSLENISASCLRLLLVNCRIGSLENKYHQTHILIFVNCRIGSLETQPTASKAHRRLLTAA